MVRLRLNSDTVLLHVGLTNTIVDGLRVIPIECIPIKDVEPMLKEQGFKCIERGNDDFSEQNSVWARYR